MNYAIYLGSWDENLLCSPQVHVEGWVENFCVFLNAPKELNLVIFDKNMVHASQTILFYFLRKVVRWPRETQHVFFSLGLNLLHFKV